MSASTPHAEVWRLVAENRVADALNTAQKALRENPSDLALGELVLRLRADTVALHKLELLRASEEHLRRAIAAVGPELQEVCNHLGTLLPARPLNLARGNGTTH